MSNEINLILKNFFVEYDMLLWKIIKKANPLSMPQKLLDEKDKFIRNLLVNLLTWKNIEPQKNNFILCFGISKLKKLSVDYLAQLKIIFGIEKLISDISQLRIFISNTNFAEMFKNKSIILEFVEKHNFNKKLFWKLI